uniref:Uncharacterized protein n=1 Tax=Pseudo-nitzschia australis TaxID=44445 RepID=A0A7S4AIA2_9STRA|mmetsp:Transcript_24961/g.54734  ORF Transcript_24961/g.54734 Transcript_24961/m.54734 type:complete len:250 (+) Transcript_24961:109-858(+)
MTTMTNNRDKNTRMPDWFRSKRSRTMSSSLWEETHPGPSSSSTATTLASVAAAVAAAYAGYEFHRSVRDYGWEGALRYVWEGDPYDPDLREAVDQLEDAEFELRATSRIDDRLSGLEESLDDATASASSTGDDSYLSVRLWNVIWMDHPSNTSSINSSSSSSKIVPLDVERTLADMSHQLDKIAANVDGIVVSSSSSSLSSNKDSFLAQRVKKRKKILSKSIVSDMERCDALLASFQVFRERTKQITNE